MNPAGIPLVPDLDDIATNAVDGPASASQDGRSGAAHPIPDQLQAVSAAGTASAVNGTNRNGGPRSPWGAMRPARVQTEGA